MGNIWQSILDVFRGALEILHGAFEGIFGADPAWGWAIIALTLIVRVLLLPLAIKQTRSMRAMQQLQPKIKKLQKKYKVDRDLMRKDPETYKQRKQKLNEEMMALYKEEGVNPASSCLPLLAQAPIFIALFSVLRDDKFTALQNADFYFVTSQLTEEPSGLGGAVSAAGWPGWALIALMAVTMFVSQRQMMARTSSEGMQAQQQKILMYVMPVFLAFVSLGFPLGVLLYWVTTNVWQMAQQYIILREVQAEGGDPGGNGAKPSRPAPSGGGQSAKPSSKKSGSDGSSPAKKQTSKSQRNKKKERDHLPRRR